MGGSGLGSGSGFGVAGCLLVGGALFFRDCLLVGDGDEGEVR